jgi:carboxypeptidase C (cathepsin A)
MTDEKIEKQEEKKATPADNLIQTRHSVVIGGKEIKYTVTTGTMVLKEDWKDRDKESEGEKAKAQIFFTAYTLDDVENPAERPLTFSFNGGPGSSSIWLHMGVLGPRRVVMEEDGSLPKPPFQLTDNEYSLLDETDLVFIDPVSTGYSRVTEGQKAREFHGFGKDIESVADFIRLYTTRYERWLSPKFLIGESYGTTRASALSNHLRERHGMYLNGIMLISAVLNFSTIDHHPGNDLPYILFLPAFAATAWYHGKLRLRRPLQNIVKQATDFAYGEYATALLKGDRLTRRERTDIVTKMARLTGLSPEFIERCHLRVSDQRFFKEILRNKGLTVGRFDSRLTGIDSDEAGESHEHDPSYDNVVGPYTAAFYHYVRAELKFELDTPYEVINMGVWPWSYKEFENRYVNVGDMLRQTITANPHMKIFVGNGYYDLATPFTATEYTFDHLNLPEALRGNISMGYYEAGHMMYAYMPALIALKADLAEFIQNSR